jgi:hypothetical protein
MSQTNQKINIKLFKPYDKQKEVINALIDDSIEDVMLLAGRRVGKSTLAENIAIYWAIHDPGCRIFWVSPSESQASKVYYDIMRALGDSIKHIIESNKGGKSDIEIVFKNGSAILFRSARSGDSLRGEGINYMILDEAAFISQTVYEQILQPMLLTSGKKLFIITTPKGKNWIFDKWNEWQEMPDCRVFRWSSYDSPYSPKSKLNKTKQSLNPKIFAQEYMAEFIDSSSVFNNISELMFLDELDAPEASKKYWAGIDIGLINDASVLSIIDEDNNIVKLYHFNNVEAPELMNEIVNINNKWKFQKIAIENNNQGLVIYQDLKRRMNNIVEFNTNTKTKGEIINKMIHMFNMKEINLVNDIVFRSELESFVFNQNQTGHMTFAADKGAHDDTVMATAIAIWCKSNVIVAGKPKFW